MSEKSDSVKRRLYKWSWWLRALLREKSEKQRRCKWGGLGGKEKVLPRAKGCNGAHALPIIIIIVIVIIIAIFFIIDITLVIIVIPSWPCWGSWGRWSVMMSTRIASRCITPKMPWEEKRKYNQRQYLPPSGNVWYKHMLSSAPLCTKCALYRRSKIKQK